MYYNSERKINYINLKAENTRLPDGYLERLFERTSVIEKIKNKDLCDFNNEDILELYKYFNVRSLDTLIVMNSQCSLYTDYCITQQLVGDNQNHYKEIDKEKMFEAINMNYTKNKILTVEAFNNIVNNFDNYCDKFVFQCLFEGISGRVLSDIYFMKISDINVKDNIVKLLSGRTTDVSNKLIAFANETNEEYYYYMLAKNGMGLRKTSLVDTGYILKRKINQSEYSVNDIFNLKFKAMVTNRMTHVLQREKLNNIITTNSIIESGLINYINNYSKLNGISAETALYEPEFYNKIVNKFDKKIVRSHFILKYKEFLVE